jgi:hypothetical protein
MRVVADRNGSMNHNHMTEPTPEDERREAAVQESLDYSAEVREEAATVIDDVIRRLERLKSDMRTHREAEQKKHPWRPHELIDPR